MPVYAQYGSNMQKVDIDPNDPNAEATIRLLMKTLYPVTQDAAIQKLVTDNQVVYLFTLQGGTKAN